MKNFLLLLLKRPAFLCGLILFLLHSLLVAYIFVSVEVSHDAQAMFSWFIVSIVDYPTGLFLYYDHLKQSSMIQELVNWASPFGRTNNIRALILFGVFGGLHWTVIGWLLGKSFLWIRKKSNRSLPS